MQSGDTVFAGSLPEIYDRYLGPALFDPYATDLARRVADITSGALLETAAGTGRVTRVLARALPDAVSIVATDLNQAMLDFAMKVSGESQLVGDADFEALRALGFSDDDIWDIAAITALFALSNRMASFTDMRPNEEFYLMGRTGR